MSKLVASGWTMNNSRIQEITLIGAGNVGYHLGKALYASGFSFHQVFSRTEGKAKELAKEVEAIPITRLSDLEAGSDLYLIAIHDNAIQEAASNIPEGGAIVAHTSGSTPIDALKDHENAGVFYPLQTFSREKEMNMSQVPFCIEGSNEGVLSVLTDLAGKVSNIVCHVDSRQRRSLHVAAVFACNFSNHLYYLASELLRKEALNLDLLLPLIRETTDKISQVSPEEAQTGPAKRNDRLTIENHISLLEQNPDHRKIYEILTNNILKTYHGQEL